MRKAPYRQRKHPTTTIRAILDGWYHKKNLNELLIWPYITYMVRKKITKIKNPMKIIHFLLGKANPNRMNGVNKVVNNLATYQTQLGYNANVWGITPTPEDRSDLPERNYNTTLFPKTSKLFISKKIEEAITTLKEKTIFHIHGGFIPEFFHLHRLLKKHKIPYIVTPHGCYNEKAMENNKAFKQIYFNVFEKELLNNAKTLHCIGKSEWQSSDKLVPNAPKVLIPNGQNLKELKYEYKRINPEDDHTPVFGFLGRMDKKMKGLDLLLEGFAIYKHQLLKDGHLWLIGGNQDFEKLKQMAVKLNIKKFVKFWGPQFGNTKLNLLANMDAFYHASRYEGMPTAILEAAALKIPCVVSDATNMMEYIKEHDAGLILDPNTAASVAESMIKIDELKEYNRLKQKGLNAYQMVKNTFDWEVISKNLVEIYAN